MKILDFLALPLSFLMFVNVSLVYGEMTVDKKGGTFKGIVRVDSSGVPGLTVKMIPPKKDATKDQVADQTANAPYPPEKITTTDKNGRFSFTGLDKGKYMLELYDGVTLIYRDIIDTSKDREKIIKLLKKRH